MLVIHFLVLVFAITENVVALSKGPPTRIPNSNHQEIHRIQRGQTLRLHCPLHSSPEPLITWKKEDRIINEGWERISIKSINHTLIIKQAEVADAGQYACQATNGFGQLTLQFTVCVTGNASVSANNGDEANDDRCGLSEHRPVFVDHAGELEELQYMAGSQVILACRVTSASKASVRWTKDGKSIKSNVDTDEEFRLTVNDVTSQDSGRYTCQASNQVGSTNFTFVLQVQERQEEKERPQFFRLDNITAFVDETVSFSCQVKSSDEQTHLKWLRQVSAHNVIQNSSTLPPLHVNGKYYNVLSDGNSVSHPGSVFQSTLLIQRVTHNDAGIYVCWAANSRGYDIRNAVLTVVPNGQLASPGPEPVEGEPYTPVFVAIGCVIGVVVLVLVIYILQHKCCAKKRSSTNSPATTSSPHSSMYAPTGPAGRSASNRKSNVENNGHSDDLTHPPSWPQSSLQRCAGYGGSAIHNGSAVNGKPVREVYAPPFLHKPLLQQDNCRGGLQQQDLQLQQQQQQPLPHQEVEYRYYEQC